VFEGLRISVVVPARNEVDWIADMVRSIPAWVDHVVVVDDASDDLTSEVAATTHRDAEVLRHDCRRGVGGAIVSGYRSALARGTDVAVVMAGDGQMCPDDLPALLRPLARGEADYAKGDRLKHPDVRRVMPPARYFAGHAFSWLTGRAVGMPTLSDSQSGYTAITRRALLAMDLSAMWTGYGYPNDLLGMVRAAGFDAIDVPVRPVYRGEKSGLRPHHLLVVGALIARVAVRRALAGERRAPATPRSQAQELRDVVPHGLGGAAADAE